MSLMLFLSINNPYRVDILLLDIAVLYMSFEGYRKSLKGRDGMKRGASNVEYSNQLVSTCSIAAYQPLQRHFFVASIDMETPAGIVL